MTGPQRTRRTLAAALTLASLIGLPLAARAQDAPPPASDAPPQTAMPPGYGPPPAAPGYPPPAAPGYPPPQPGYPPPGYGPGYPPPGYVPILPPETHAGLYLRLHVGGGFTSASGSDNLGNKVTISGGSVSLGVAVGGAVAPNLALFGAVLATVATQPNVNEPGYGSTTASGNISLGGIGAGIVYYFEPINIYLSGVIAAMDLQGQDANGNTTGETKVGPGFQLMVGKEWWVSSHWGLGVAGEFMAATMKDKNDSSITWNSDAFSILFSATCF
jgi:hypothetical protein